jgi:hypothetical protein
MIWPLLEAGSFLAEGMEEHERAQRRQPWWTGFLPWPRTFTWDLRLKAQLIEAIRAAMWGVFLLYLLGFIGDATTPEPGGSATAGTPDLWQTRPHERAPRRMGPMTRHLRNGRPRGRAPKAPVTPWRPSGRL